MAKEIFVAYGVDVDAVAGWLGSYGGENSPDDISRGLFAGEVGTPRLLRLFDRYDLKTTWFIPGHSIETFPSETEQVVAAGHEIGIHGYTHENPLAMTREQDGALVDLPEDRVVDPDLAELVHDHGRVSERRAPEHGANQRRLAAAEVAGDERDRRLHGASWSTGSSGSSGRPASRSAAAHSPARSSATSVRPLPSVRTY